MQFVEKIGLLAISVLAVLAGIGLVVAAWRHLQRTVLVD
jgi:hypothetical protein